ncbi:MAG: 2'-5' RNA ligase family protein [Candidatus Competibacteraceae bacterium]|nr:2'-5' RNA ligase family protein [Candidatus Competibacteraceae bacterium]
MRGTSCACSSACRCPGTSAGAWPASLAGCPAPAGVAPDNLHVTLRFIGEVDDGQAEDIDAALAAIRAPAFAVTVAGVRFDGCGDVCTRYGRGSRRARPSATSTKRSNWR